MRVTKYIVTYHGTRCFSSKELQELTLSYLFMRESPSQWCKYFTRIIINIVCR